MVFETVFTGMFFGVACVGLGHLVERRVNRAVRHGQRMVFNLACHAVGLVLQALLAPFVSGATVMLVNELGGGFIALPHSGLSLVVGVLVYTVAVDLGEYLYHRAQHAWPWLWAMHSLHHSDSAVNVSTTVRHYWAESLIKAVSIHLVVAIIFKVDLAIIGVYGLISTYNYLSHMDVRLGFGRWSWLLNSPQYHRLHHSRLPGDENCNFAALLPLWDVISGAYRRPRAGEFPPTGLPGEEGPASLLEAIGWPARGLVALIPSGFGV